MACLALYRLRGYNMGHTCHNNVINLSSVPLNTSKLRKTVNSTTFFSEANFDRSCHFWIRIVYLQTDYAAVECSASHAPAGPKVSPASACE